MVFFTIYICIHVHITYYRMFKFYFDGLPTLSIVCNCGKLNFKRLEDGVPYFLSRLFWGSLKVSYICITFFGGKGGRSTEATNKTLV